jgi:DNA-directed RNA polymerase specialized sigma24 family protein
MRPRLLRFFESRQCLDPENLAQETLSRAWRRLTAGAEVHICSRDSFYYGIARYVLFEHLRWRRRRAEDSIALLDNVADNRQDAIGVERRLLVDECLGKLDADEQRLLVVYFRDGPEPLRTHLRLTAVALRLRVHRVLTKVRQLVGDGRRSTPG